MRQLAEVRPFSIPKDDTTMLKKQLRREIACLEFQLERLKKRDEFLDLITLQTYEEMIGTRRDMLDSL